MISLSCESATRATPATENYILHITHRYCPSPLTSTWLSPTARYNVRRNFTKGSGRACWPISVIADEAIVFSSLPSAMALPSHTIIGMMA